jgi:hypothetical protein
MIKMRVPSSAKLLGALGFLALAGCTSPTPYAPREPGGYTGYTDQRLDQNRYRVTFTGNSVTRRETVEDYLLLRSAEVTLQSSFRYFVFDTRDTEAKTTYRSDFVGWPGWHGRGFWYRHTWPYYDPFFDGPPYDTVQSYPITRYQAYAEIVMLTPEQAKDDPTALDARDVVDHIGARAVTPQQQGASAPPPPPPPPRDRQ